MATWNNTSFTELCDEVRSGRHRHVVMLMGSAISVGHPSNCLMVGQIRTNLVLEPVRDAAPPGEIQRIVGNLLRSVDGVPSREAVTLGQLPFEQFMGCLHLVDSGAGFGIIELGCGRGFGRCPNANHEAVADVAAWLLTRGRADRVTVLTTNYDPWLDEALARALGAALAPVGGLSIPRFENQHGNGMLRYAKLHGTLDDRNSLVFTFEQMARLVVDATELSAIGAWLMDGAAPSLLLAAGYGFWDPDLRPLIRQLVPQGSILVRNEKPSHAQDSGTPPASIAPTGPEFLQAEFFGTLAQHAKLLEYRSPLWGSNGGPENPSMLTGLRKALALPDHDDAPPPSPSSVTDLQRRAGDMIAAGVANRAGVFLGRLLDAACIPERTDLFKASAAKATDPDRRELVRDHLYTLSNAHRMDEAAEECRSIRSEMPEVSVAATTLAFESFALSIGGQRSLLGAAGCLRRCAALLPQCDADTAAYVEHYDSHFRVKVLEVLLLKAGNLGYVMGLHRIASRKAERMADRLQEAIGKARQSGDLRLMSDAMTLLVECLILARRLDEAADVARIAREVRLFLGRFNNAALSDRMMGWIALARGDDESRGQAIRHFARGLWRADSCNDVSIRAKIAANLVRALHGRGVAGLDLNGKIKQAPTGLATACHRLAEGEFSWQGGEPVMDPNLARAADTVLQYVAYLYGERSSALRSEMFRYSNLERFPIYLPIDPPDHGE